ncbi:MAG: tetratricopeptide repeat protein [Bacteroidota bacterium]
MAQISDSQKKEIDSLKEFIGSSSNDTLVVNAYRQWDDIIYISDVDLDFLLNKKIASLCKKNLKKNLSYNEVYFFKKNLASAQNIFANYYSDHGKLDSAMFNYQSAMVIYQEIKNMSGVANCYAGIAILQWKEGDIPEAVNNNLRALAIYDALGAQNAMANVYLNLGIINRGQGNTKEALKNYNDALAIQKKLGDEYGEANSYNNISTVYLYSGDYNKALEYNEKGYELRKKMGDVFGLASSSMNQGIVYHSFAYREEKKGNSIAAAEYYKRALENYELSLRLNTEAGDAEGVAMSVLNLGSLYLNLKEKTKARHYLEKGQEMAAEIKSKSLLKETFQFKSSLDSMEGDFKNAYFNYRNFISYRDSLINEDNTKKIVEQKAKYEYEKRAAADSVAFTKQKEIAAEQIKTQEAQLESEKTQRYSLYGGLALIAVFSVFLFNRFRVTQRQKKLIEEQKAIVEEKQKEIVDSINYAKRIQNAILPDEKDFASLFTDAFVLFKPKDIVSGDYYWVTEKKSFIFYATADCTGHGVPGGFMSMLGNSFLNEIVMEKNISEPSAILNELRDKVIAALKQTGNVGENKDGMDIVLTRFDLEHKKLLYASANNDFYIIRNNELLVCRPDKQPIGYYNDTMKPFSQHEVQLEKGDCVYTFTDGYADQFGGAKGKKLKYKNLESLLMKNHTLPFAEQKEVLNDFIENWRGELEQNDDICLIGIKI